ncbi:H/ACA ribonucleoprotein complex subunit 4-like [Oryza brachyantha]|uniref:H/ACA ribonucleoprotein complex subunit 4-like n=1 Tax=Oryza brachyantha TaxID=4533 RepID=UPI0003EA9C00|nr:H/ACA ribonucleoprotein complex subunit 4-like [Oryza brachyantha]
MRAISGTILSSRPCSLAKAAAIITRFADSAASHLPCPDAATYLRTAADATAAHHLFRRDLRKYYHGDIAPASASASATDRKIKKHIVIPALSASASASERKVNKEKHSKEHHESSIHVKQEVEEIPSPEKKRTQKKRSKEMNTDASAGDLGSLAAEQDLGSDRKRKKKRERGDDNEQLEHTSKKPRNRS